MILHRTGRIGTSPALNRNSPQARGLVAAFPMSNFGGATLFSTIRGVEGAASGTLPVPERMANGVGLKFSASNTLVTIPRDLAGSGPASFSFWINIAGGGGGGYGRIFIDDSAKTIIWTDLSSRVLFTSDGNTALTVTLEVGKPFHVLFSRTASGAGIGYVNGIAMSSGATGTPTANGTNSYIGNAPALNRNLAATLFDFRVYNRALVSNEVMDIYRRPAGLYYPQRSMVCVGAIASTAQMALWVSGQQAQQVWAGGHRAQQIWTGGHRIL